MAGERRYFRVDVAGPTWWMVATDPAHAWILWATWHQDHGATEEALEADPRMVELAEGEARAVKVTDDPVADNLAGLELGATICTEF